MFEKFLGKECKICVAFAYDSLITMAGYTSSVLKGKIVSEQDDYIEFKVAGKKEKIILINKKYIVYVSGV